MGEKWALTGHRCSCGADCVAMCPKCRKWIHAAPYNAMSRDHIVYSFDHIMGEACDKLASLVEMAKRSYDLAKGGEEVSEKVVEYLGFQFTSLGALFGQLREIKIPTLTEYFSMKEAAARMLMEQLTVVKLPKADPGEKPN